MPKRKPPIHPEDNVCTLCRKTLEGATDTVHMARVPVGDYYAHRACYNRKFNKPKPAPKAAAQPPATNNDVAEEMGRKVASMFLR